VSSRTFRGVIINLRSIIDTNAESDCFNFLGHFSKMIRKAGSLEQIPAADFQRVAQLLEHAKRWAA